MLLLSSKPFTHFVEQHLDTCRVISACILLFSVYFLFYPVAAKQLSHLPSGWRTSEFKSQSGRWWQPTAGLTRGFTAIYKGRLREAQNWNILSMPLFSLLILQLFIRPFGFLLLYKQNHFLIKFLLIDVIFHSLTLLILIAIFFFYAFGYIAFHNWTATN